MIFKKNSPSQLLSNVITYIFVIFTKLMHIQLGALDATVYQVMSSRFNIKGFPTIKYFAPGSSASDAEDYVGGRTSDDIVQYALNKVKLLFSRNYVYYNTVNIFQVVLKCTIIRFLLNLKI